MSANILACIMLLLMINGSSLLMGQEDKWSRKALKARQPDKKIEYFTKSIETENAKAESHLNRGDVYWTLAIDAAYNHHLFVIVLSKEKADFHNAKLMYDKAKEDYTKAIEIDSSCAMAYIKRSDVYWQLGQKDKALEDLSLLIARDPDNTEAFSKRAFIYWNDFRDPEKAIADASIAIQIDPDYTPAYHARGYYAYHLKQYEIAMADYIKSIEINPNDARAYFGLGDVYRLTGQYDKAIAEYNMAIDLDRKNFMTYNSRGMAYLIQSQYEKALKDFKKAISLHPSDFPFSYNNAGYVYLQQDKTDLAVKSFQKCLSVDNEFTAANLNLSLAYSRIGDQEKAMFYLEKEKEFLLRFQEGMDGYFKSNEEWYYWTESDKETLAKIFEELK